MGVPQTQDAAVAALMQGVPSRATSPSTFKGKDDATHDGLVELLEGLVKMNFPTPQSVP